MKRITTESGAVYLLDEKGPRGTRVMRAQGDVNGYMRLPNDQWADVYSYEVEVGKRGVFDLSNFFFRITTPVVSIEDME